MRLLLLTPPLTQLNTPYPGTAYLVGALQVHGPQAVPGLQVFQADAGIDLVLRLFSRRFLSLIRDDFSARPRSELSATARNFLTNADAYISCVEPVIRFLQGRDTTLSSRIAARTFLPEGRRFAAAESSELLESAFGALGTQDQAKFLASLFIDDLADLIQSDVDPHFGLSRYGDRLAASRLSFDTIAEGLQRVADGGATRVEQELLALVDEYASTYTPDVVGFSAPFPGNVYGAFLMADRFKAAGSTAERPVRAILGGGYVNTELREMQQSPVARDPRVFERFDAITFDDGERPLLALLSHWNGQSSQEQLLRTLICTEHEVRWVNSLALHDIPQKEAGCPSYAGLALEKYISLAESLNPMHRIWSDGRWNKLTLAHGCYWRKCNFCDVSLDYIGRYEASPAVLTVDRMERLIRETGQSGFHLVDEAAPPALLKQVALEVLRRGLVVTWWGNVRFEKAFTPELCELLAESGCIALSGGLEVASDRLLKLMNKGVTVEQVARVTYAMTQAGIMVHAYLMYGFPTQTRDETIESLERVRQLFALGCIQSAFWHRFSVTAHSPVGKNPAAFGVKILTQGPTRFAWNDLEFEDPTGVDHDSLGIGLNRALYNYMLGQGLDQDVRTWFVELKQKGVKLGKTAVPSTLIQNALEL